jgi:hypothetical protein
MDPKLNAIADKIRVQAGIPKEEQFGSIIAILMIISITLTIIRVIQECNKNKLSSDATAQHKYALYGDEIRMYSYKRGWFTKLRIKRLIKKQMSKDQYAKYGFQLLSAMLDAGENLQDDEVVTLVEAANV